MNNPVVLDSKAFDSLVHAWSETADAQPSADNRAPLSLANADAAWLVTAGTVDIFYTRSNGAREFVLRVPSGHMFFGWKDARALIAVGGPDTRVLATTRAHLLELAHDNAVCTLIAALCDAWIQALCAAVTATSPAPQVPAALKSGALLALNDGDVARPTDGVVCVRIDTGQANWLGRADLPLAAGIQIPFSDEAWLVAAGKAQLSILPTDSLWSKTANAASLVPLDALHALVLKILTQRTADEIAAEQTRLRQRDINDTALVREAFMQVAKVLEPSRLAPNAASSASDELFAVCTLVAEAHQILLIRPPAANAATTANPLDEITRASRVETRRVELKGEWWCADNGSLLAYRTSDKQPQALLWEGRQYVLVDGFQTRRVVTAQVAATLDPYAVMFYRPFADRALGLTDLVRFGAGGNGRTLVLILLLGIGVGLLALATPIATDVLFNIIIPGAARSQLVQLGIVLFAAAIATALLSAAQSLATLRVENQMDVSLQAAVWDRLLKLPVPFFRDYSTGDLANRALGISAIRQALTGPVVFAFLAAIFSLFSFGLMFYYSIELAGIGTLLVLVAVFMAGIAAYVQVRYQRRITTIQGYLASTLLQFLTSISKLRVSGSEDRAFAQWAAGYTRQEALTYRAALVNGALTVFNATFPILATLVLFLVITLSSGELFDTGTFLAFNTAFVQFLGATLAVSMTLISVLTIVPIYERAKPILQTLPEVDNAKASPGILRGRIELSNVTFRYSADTPYILNGVSLRAEPGEFIAIVGPSGAGKSTLVRMLLGFDQPATGTVLYDGQSLADLDLRAVRRQIGTVLQSSQVMPGSIFNNIVGAQPLSMQDAWAAAHAAGLEEDIRAMPMGMQTVLIGEDGSLSGGQEQRLLIARAIVNKPRMILFDEATSALDNRTQAIVTASLQRLHATRIVIAHRLSTIINADRIYVLTNGAIVETGTYAELMAQAGVFADLAKRQLV
jgi:NHLM bacteriocin system ABC transporter ATP-binding protein